jgi:hypothetical protein
MTPITYARKGQEIRSRVKCTSGQRHLFDSLPICVIVRQIAQVFKLELKGSSFRSAAESVVVPVWHSFPLAEVNHRPRHAGGRIEHGHHPVAEFNGPFEVYGCFGEVMCGEEASKDSDCGLDVFTTKSITRARVLRTSKVL